MQKLIQQVQCLPDNTCEVALLLECLTRSSSVDVEFDALEDCGSGAVEPGKDVATGLIEVGSETGVDWTVLVGVFSGTGGAVGCQQVQQWQLWFQQGH